MTATEQQEHVADRLGLLPTRKSAYTEKVLSDPVRNAFYLALTKAVPRAALAESGSLFTAFEPHWTAVLRREKEPREALREAAESWRASLLPHYRIVR